MLVVAVVAIIVVGPKDLPKMLRSFGKVMGNMRRMAGDFQKQFDDAVREAELDEVKNIASVPVNLNGLKVQDGGTANALTIATDVVVAPGGGFYANPARGRTQIRLAAVLEKQKLERAAEILAAGIRSYKGRVA